jgi:predicted  nucleic acid-binding Zn-ribbon protein
MWKQILDMARRLFMLAEDTKRNHDEIKELRDEMRRLTATVERLAYEIHRIGDRETSEREKLILQLDNRLLKFEKSLPPKKPRRDKGAK